MANRACRTWPTSAPTSSDLTQPVTSVAERLGHDSLDLLKTLVALPSIVGGFVLGLGLFMLSAFVTLGDVLPENWTT